MTAQELATKIAELALSKKGKEITILDLRTLSDITDFFVIVTCDSDVQLKTIANHIEKTLKDEKVTPYHKEGLTKLNWVLLDYVDVVAHLFRGETREFYALERLWADAKVTKVDDDAGDRTVPGAAN